MISTFKYLFYLTILAYCSFAFSQEVPPIQDFLPKDYNAENQNWAISQSSDNLIYVANDSGLLEYNGSEWSSYESPNNTIIRSVNAIENVIYTGAYMEFGYWKKDEFNILRYTSLSDQIKNKLIDDEQFWGIHKLGNGTIVFQSLNRIYIYHIQKQEFRIIDSTTSIVKSYNLDNVLYYQEYNKGLFKIVNDKAVLVLDDPTITQETIINLFSVDGQLWLLTQNNGFYQITEGGVIESDISSNNLIKNRSIYSALKLKDGSFILGTISDGVIQLDATGNLIMEITQQNGLLNNTVLSILEDNQSNIWLGLDNGLNCINLNSPFKLFNDPEGKLGSVYASAIFEGRIYLGTNQGLYHREINSKKPFQFIENTEGQVWSLFKFNNTLFCCHHTGTYTVEETKIKKIPGTTGSWHLRPTEDKNLLLQGNYDGLSVIEKIGDGWQIRNKLKGFKISSRHFELMPNNTIFVNHEYKGIFKLKSTKNFDSIIEVELDTSFLGANSSIIKYENDLIYAYKKGIYKYSESKSDFIKHPYLNELYNPVDYVSGKLAMDTTGDYLWSFSKSNINYVYTDNSENNTSIKRIPINSAMRGNIVGYENVLHLKNDTYLFGGVSGYILVDLSKLDHDGFKVSIDQIYQTSNSSFNKRIPLAINSSSSKFKSDENNLGLSFYVPKYQKYLATEYQYQLNGIYDEWSPWSKQSSETFKNLQHGNYEFRVRAKIGDKISDNEEIYTFEIQKPWYLSNTAIAIYIIAVLLFSLFMHRIYKSYYKRQQQKLVNKKDQEMRLLKAENESQMIRIKNEHLKHENKLKGKELAASAMSIIRKNEVLYKVKTELKEVENKKLIGPVLKIINQSINKNGDWEFFKEAFNNADKGFLNKVKEIYPNLTPNDLKLCAYLRLNLSSKEIAPLFHISPRSVEIKRYRLRKKMELDHDVNLVNHILEI